MSSQNNNSRISLNKISNFILNEQNDDIRAYTSGHLNENHLWKPPEQKTHKQWDTSKPTKLAFRSANKHKLDKSSTNNTTTNAAILNMCETLADFSIGTKLSDFTKRNKLSKDSNDSTNIDREIDELKLPNISKSSLQSDTVSRKQSRSDESNSQTTQSINLPLTDKEIALNFLNGPFNGVTKQEKFKNFNKFEKEILKKDDLIASNYLHGTETAQYLEKRLNEELEKLNTQSVSSYNSNLLKLQIYNDIFEELIKESKLFGNILNKIKNEYDNHIFNLMRSQTSETSLSNESAESVKLEKTVRQGEISRLDLENKKLEELIRQMYKSKLELENNISIETNFNLQKTAEADFVESRKNLANNTNKNEEKQVKLTIGDKLEATRSNILDKLDTLNSLNEKLKNDYVPNSVINNLNSSIKDVEVETHKLIEQNRFLKNQELEVETDLKNILLKYDKTEFANDNVEYLLKCIKNFDVLKLEDSEANKNSQTLVKAVFDTNNTQENEQSYNQIENDFQHRYDDYFS